MFVVGDHARELRELAAAWQTTPENALARVLREAACRRGVKLAWGVGVKLLEQFVAASTLGAGSARERTSEIKVETENVPAQAGGEGPKKFLH